MVIGSEEDEREPGDTQVFPERVADPSQSRERARADTPALSGFRHNRAATRYGVVSDVPAGILVGPVVVRGARRRKRLIGRDPTSASHG